MLFPSTAVVLPFCKFSRSAVWWYSNMVLLSWIEERAMEKVIVAGLKVWLRRLDEEIAVSRILAM